MFYLYPLVYSVKYKAPSLMWAVSVFALTAFTVYQKVPLVCHLVIVPDLHLTEVHMGLEGLFLKFSLSTANVTFIL